MATPLPLLATAEEFLAAMAEVRGWTVEALTKHRRAARVARCDEYDVPHWELRFIDDDERDRRDEIEIEAGVQDTA